VVKSSRIILGDYSIKLKINVLDPWIKFIENMEIGLISDSFADQYNSGLIRKRDKITIVKIGDPQIIIFDKFKEHLESGYKSILNEWEELTLGDCLTFAP